MTIKDKIRRRNRLTVEIDGEAVTVRALSAREWVAFSDAVTRRPDGRNDGADFLVRLVVATARQADGTPAFEEADIAWLTDEADMGPLRRLFDAACELNGIGLAARERNGDAVKN